MDYYKKLNDSIVRFWTNRTCIDINWKSLYDIVEEYIRKNSLDRYREYVYDWYVGSFLQQNILKYKHVVKSKINDSIKTGIFYINVKITNKHVIKLPIPNDPFFVFWIGAKKMEFGFKDNTDVLSTPTIYDLVYFISKRIKIENITRITPRTDCSGSVRIEYR